MVISIATTLTPPSLFIHTFVFKQFQSLFSRVWRVGFSSTGSVYGEPEVHPTPENAPFPTQTSMYGASKLAGEGLIQAYSVGYGFESYIFRFVSLT